jgi:hypothetical protein
MRVSYESRTRGAPTFIDLDKAYPDQSRFSVVIWGRDRSKFSPNPEQLYTHQTLCVTGNVEDYNGVAEIQVAAPSAIVLAPSSSPAVATTSPRSTAAPVAPPTTAPAPTRSAPAAAVVTPAAFATTAPIVVPTTLPTVSLAAIGTQPGSTIAPAQAVSQPPPTIEPQTAAHTFTIGASRDVSSPKRIMPGRVVRANWSRDHASA